MSPVSFATITPGNFELTPCRVTFKGVDLGATKGNVKVSIEETLANLTADQLGTTVIDKRSSGFKCTVETTLDETQNKNNWKTVFPMHKLITNETTGQQSFFFDSQVGASQRSFAGPLILHPLSRPNTDLSGDIMLYLATAEAKSGYEFSPTAQNGLKIDWMMYPDFTTSPPRFMQFGDPSIGIVNAFTGAATAATGNTGNGNVSNITAFNGSTLTETVTALCVTPGTGGNFFVSGSVGGPYGLAAIGTTFNAPGGEISLKVNNGGTAFALNDSFSIATTASNYM